MKKNWSLLWLLVVIFIGTNAFAARTRYFSTDINGARIAYTITGNNRNPTIVLIHGYPLNGDLFERQRRVLGDFFRIITVDLRGFGRSIAPNETASIDVYADDVLALLNFLNVRQATIGGHSMGGAVVLRLYQNAPERFEAMILNDPAALPPPTLEQFTFRGYQQQARENGAEAILPALLPEFLTGRTRATRPLLVADISNQINTASLNGLIGGAFALETRPNFTALFPTIEVPTLLLYGEEDSLTPMEQGRTLDSLFPNAQLVIVRGATHGVIREDPEAANFAILRFIFTNLNGGNLKTAITAPAGVSERLITIDN